MKYEQLDKFYFSFTNKGRLSNISYVSPKPGMLIVETNYNESFIWKYFNTYITILKQDFLILLKEGLKQNKRKLIDALNDKDDINCLIDNAILWRDTENPDKWSTWYDNV